jgi:lysophospholipase L1-like esterase
MGMTAYGPHLSMRRFGTVFMALLVFLLLGVETRPAQGFSPHPDPIRIMPLGDSITLGEGDESLQGYRKTLYRELVKSGYDVDFVGAKQDGQSVPASFDHDHQGTPRQKKEELAGAVSGYLTNHPADIVLLHIGTNAPSIDAEPVRNILDTIDSFSTDTKVILARIINTYRNDEEHTTVTRFNENVVAMAVKRTFDDISIVDMEGQIHYPVHYADTIHPNPSGYAKMADIWLEALLESLPAPQGMTSYWKLEDGSGSTFIDTKLLNHARCSFDCPLPATGRVGEGQLFSASTCIEVAGDDSFDWTNEDSYTIEFWFKKESSMVDSQEIMVGRSNSNSTVRWMVGIKPSDGKSVAFFSMRGTIAPSATLSLSSTKKIHDDEWHHIAVVRDTRAGENIWKLYFDGVVEDEHAGSFNKVFNSHAPLCFGNLDCTIGDQQSQFHGLLDEIAIYNRPLSGAEVLMHYQNGFSDEGYYYTGPTVPHIKPITLISVQAGSTYTYLVQPVGRPAPELSIVSGPKGMTIDRFSGQLRWKASSPGSYDVEIRAVNAVGSTTRAFTLTVSEASGSSSGGGCLLNAQTSFGLEWLLLLFGPALIRMRSRANR